MKAGFIAFKNSSVFKPNVLIRRHNYHRLVVCIQWWIKFRSTISAVSWFWVIGHPFMTFTRRGRG